MNDEEIKFLWRCLSEYGQLTPQKLREVMNEVCGFDISPIASRDVLASAAS